MRDINAINRSNIGSLVIGALLLAALIAGQFFLWDMVGSTSNRIWQQRNAQSQLSIIQESIKNIEQTNIVAQSVQQQLTQVFIPEGKVTQAVERLEREADRQEVTVEVREIQRSAQGGQGGLSRGQLIVTITAQGTPDKLFRYIDSIENFPEITFIRDFSLTRSASTAPSKAPYTLSANIIFFLANETGGNSSQAVSQPTASTTSTTPRLTSSFADNILYWGGLGASGGGILLVLVGTALLIKRRMIV